MGHTGHFLFIFIRSKEIFYIKNSGIRTRIVEVEGKRDDHLSTTTVLYLHFYKKIGKKANGGQESPIYFSNHVIK